MSSTPCSKNTNKLTNYPRHCLFCIIYCSIRGEQGIGICICMGMGMGIAIGMGMDFTFCMPQGMYVIIL